MKPYNNLLLLPRKFKKIGYLILGITIIFMLQAVYFNNIEPSIFKALSTSGLLSSFLILAQTKFNHEDERSIQIRLFAWFSAIIFITIHVIISPFINLWFNGMFALDADISRLLITMFIFYFIMIFLTNANES